MNEKIKIVSGGDSNYFDLLNELLLSIENLKLSDNYSITFLDGGLNADEKNYFISKGIDVIDPGWPDKISKIRSKNKEFLKVELAKVNLDKIFNDVDHIIWIDADAWLQTDAALKIMLSITRKNKLAIYSQASRKQEYHIAYKNFFGPLVILRNVLYKAAIKGGLKKNIKESLIARPNLNAGIFALSRLSPHWQRLRHWQKNLLLNFRLRVFSITQLAIGIIIYHEKFEYEPLPDICNYMDSYRWSKEMKLFIDIYAPYEPVSIIHMAGNEESRKNKNHLIEMLDEQDNLIKKSIRFNSN